jgi:hypothetical protein
MAYLSSGVPDPTRNCYKLAEFDPPVAQPVSTGDADGLTSGRQSESRFGIGLNPVEIAVWTYTEFVQEKSSLRSENSCFQKSHYHLRHETAILLVRPPRPSIAIFTETSNLGSRCLWKTPLNLVSLSKIQTGIFRTLAVLSTIDLSALNRDLQTHCHVARTLYIKTPLLRRPRFIPSGQSPNS